MNYQNDEDRRILLKLKEIKCALDRLCHVVEILEKKTEISVIAQIEKELAFAQLKLEIGKFRSRLIVYQIQHSLGFNKN